MNPIKAFGELEWFLKGDQSPYVLRKNNIKYWNEWIPNSDNSPYDLNSNIGVGIGRGYGVQLRNWTSPRYSVNVFSGELYPNSPLIGNDYLEVDQVQDLIDQIKTNPESRRLLLTYWNPGELCHTTLPPCITVVQFWVDGQDLSACVYQRSADVMLGLPFDVANNALLVHLVANECNLTPKTLTYFTGDTHVYEKHIDAAKVQLERDPIAQSIKIIIPKGMGVNNFKAEEIKFETEIIQHPAIKFDVAV
jgi:thymidylate synthase